MLSKKSPRTICRIGICNNRIGANGFSNRNCASSPSLESIFRARVSKIVFRQHRPRTDLTSSNVGATRRGLKSDLRNLGGPDHLGPFFGFIANELAEFGEARLQNRVSNW